MSSDNKAKIVLEGEDRFSRTFQAFERTVKGSERAVVGLEQRVGGLGLTLGALGTGFTLSAVFTAVKQVADSFDALNDAADITGEKIEVLSGLEDVARRNGGGLDVVTDSLVKLNKALADTKPDSEVSRALGAIGLSAEELRRKSPADALQEIARALQGFADDGEKARVVATLTGKSIKEIAPFLNDLAQAGKINASVTEDQAKAAERFNKNLYELQTNVSNAARSLVGDLIPAVNSYFDTVRKASNGGANLFWRELTSEVAGVRFNLAVQKVNDLAEAVSKNPGNNEYARLLAEARQEADALGRAAEDANAKLKATLGTPIAPPDAGGGRGFVNPDQVKPRVSIPDAPKHKSDAQSEAERYLETLQKEGEKQLQLTGYEQALLDIQQRRIAGITPQLEKQILAQAQLNDLSKQAITLRTAEVESQSRAARAALDALDAQQKQNAELEKEVSVIGLTEAAIADLELARLSATIAQKEATIAEREAAGVGEERLQVLNAEIDALKRRKELLVAKVDKNATEEARKAVDDVAERSQSQLSSSIEQGILDGFRNSRSIGNIFLNELKAQFGKTVLRPIIDPIAAAGNVVLNNLLSSIFGSFKAFDTGGIGITSGNTGLADLGLGGGRANGGSVKPGMRYRVNENGTEEFIPDVPGTILSANQRRQQAAAQPPVIVNQHWTVNGDVSPQTIAAMQAMIARNNQQLLRSARTGGAYAT